MVPMTLAMAAEFVLASILALLGWAALLVLNLWIWQKSKAKGNLLMMLGAALEALVWLIMTLSTYPSAFVAVWLPLIGLYVFIWGFYLSVKPMVQAQIEALKKRITPEAKPDGGGEKKEGGDAS